MATKTITIDLNAYETLRRRKKKGQSFSDVIKEHFSSSFTGRDLDAILDTLDVSDESLDALDALIEERREDPARIPDL